MADIVQHPRSPKKSSPSGVEEIRTDARSILTAPKLDFETSVRMVTEMYERSALPAPPDIKGYIRAIANALADYPAPIAEECCNPKNGVTRHLQWRPEVNQILDFCDRRMEFYRSLTAERPRPEPIAVRPSPSAENIARVKAAVARVAQAMRARTIESERIKAERFLMEQALPAANAGGQSIDVSDSLRRILHGHEVKRPEG